MLRYGMKASAESELQLLDRIKKFEALGLDPFIELYLSSLEQISGGREKVFNNCVQFSTCDYSVHFPVQDAKGTYLFDPINDVDDDLELILDFCGSIRARSLIIHRCFGFGELIDREEAQDKLLKKIILWNDLASKRSVQLLIENYGFVWLPSSYKKKYVISTLDHFYPWEMTALQQDIKKYGLDNIEIMLDTAHANVTSSMYNMLKSHPELSSDHRFSNILEQDMMQAEFLSVRDFMFDFVNYFHVSDSLVWNNSDGIDDIQKFIYAEGLPISKGNFDYRTLFRKTVNDKVLIMEINPSDGDHDNCNEQYEAIKLFKQYYN